MIRDGRHSDLADGGQFGEKHLEDWSRQRLLQHLEQLLGLTANCNGIGQVVHSFLKVTWIQKVAKSLEYRSRNAKVLTETLHEALQCLGMNTSRAH